MSLVAAVWEDDVAQLTALLEQGLDISSPDESGHTSLDVATMKDNVSMVNYLLQKGAACNTPGRDGNCPIHIATRNSSRDMVEVLLRSGADVNAENPNKNTPLCLAAKFANLDLIDLLLTAGADVNKANLSGWSALHQAIQHNTLDTVSLLLAHGADVIAQTEEGWGSLHLAAQKNNLEMAVLLIESGVDVNFQSKSKATALHLATLDGSLEIMDLLLSKGADVNLQDEKGYNALMHAAYQGNKDKVHMLLGRRCDLHATNLQGWNALHAAANNAGVEVIKMLIDAGMKEDANVRNSKDHTALQQAIESNSIDAVCLLLDLEEDINIASETGWTNIHHVACYGDNEKLQALLSKNINVNPKPSSHSPTPLHLAVTYGNPDMVRLLLEHGSDVSVPDSDGYVPLHAAVQYGHPETVWLLLENEADVNAATPSGMTALHLASRIGDVNVIQMMLSKGADLHVARNDGMTPLHLAIINNSLSTIELLLNLEAETEILDKKKYSPLHYALLHCGSTVVKLLIDRGADVTCKADGQKTCLRIAVESQNYENIKTMLGYATSAVEIKEAMQYALALNCSGMIIEEIDHAYSTVEDSMPLTAEDLQKLYRPLYQDTSATDNHEKNGYQQSVLHCAATLGVKKHIEILMEAGENLLQEDKNGVTPLQLLMKHTHVLRSIQDQYSKYFDDEAYEYATWFKTVPQSDQIIGEILPIEMAQDWMAPGVADMSLPERGFTWLQMNETSSEAGHKEFKQILEGVDAVVQYIVQLMAEKNDKLKTYPILVGSLSEGTKCGYPDQFDYFCEMAKLSQFFKFPLGENSTSTLQCIHKDHFEEFCDEKGNLSSLKLASLFGDALCDSLEDHSYPDSLPQGFFIMKGQRSTGKMPAVTLVWCGSVFKWLPITVNFQLAIEVDIPKTSLRELPIEVPGLGYCASLMADDKGKCADQFQISHTLAETKLFHLIHEDIRLGYILAKNLRSSKICPQLDIHINDSPTNAEQYLPSYLLKTALFYELMEAREEEPIVQFDTEVHHPNIERAVVWADRIFARLEYYLEQGYMPSYYAPVHDLLFGEIILTGTEMINKLRNDNDISQKRNVMYSYCNIIRGKLLHG